MKFITPYRIVVTMLLALAGAVLLIGLNAYKEPEPPNSRDQRIVNVSPAPDELALRQDRIFAELANNYTGILIVDGREIPEDQIDHSEGLNTVGYTPGPGTETGALKPGQRCAIVVYWPQTSTREAASNSYKWCWGVH
jgi:hypothetical protein